MRKLPTNIGKAQQEGRLSAAQQKHLARLDEIEKRLPSTSAEWQAIWKERRAESVAKNQANVQSYAEGQIEKLKEIGLAVGDEVSMQAASMLPNVPGQLHQGTVKQGKRGNVYVHTNHGNFDVFRNPWRKVEPPAAPSLEPTAETPPTVEIPPDLPPATEVRVPDPEHRETPAPAGVSVSGEGKAPLRDYDAINKIHRRLRSELTRAVNSKDPEKVIAAARAAVAEWETWHWGWPDDWSRWQRALNDALPWGQQMALEDLRGSAPATPEKQPSSKQPAETAADRTQATPPSQQDDQTTSPLRIEDLTKTSIIVRGDTKTHKDRIKALRGLWNGKQQGWVFPKKREAQVRAGLEDLLAAEAAPGETWEPDAQSITPAAKAEAPAAYGAANKIFTADAAAAARERLRKKLGTVRIGLDPEMFQDGMTLAGFHIEAGARKYADFAKAMIADLGEAARPYLRRWYNAVKNNHGFDFGAAAGEKQSIMGEKEPTQAEEGNDVRPQSESSPHQPGGASDVPSLGEGTRPVDQGQRGRGARGEAGTDAEELAPATPEDDETPRGDRRGGPGDHPELQPGGSRDGVHPRGDADLGRAGAGGEGMEPVGVGGGRGGGTAGEGGDRGGVTEAPPPPKQPTLGNYHIADPERLIGGGPKSRFAHNRAAIEAYKAFTDEGRDPTPAILRPHYAPIRSTRTRQSRAVWAALSCSIGKGRVCPSCRCGKVKGNVHVTVNHSVVKPIEESLRMSLGGTRSFDKCARGCTVDRR